MEGLSVFTLWATLVGGWSAIGAVVISGPAVLDTEKLGSYREYPITAQTCMSSAEIPFLNQDGISGSWCWITPQYKTQQIMYVFPTILQRFWTSDDILFRCRLGWLLVSDCSYVSSLMVLTDSQLLLAAVFSLVLYPLIFLRLRGNIIRNGWRIKFTRVAVENFERWRGLPTKHSIRIAKQMLL